jgi:hypothetical protein
MSRLFESASKTSHFGVILVTLTASSSNSSPSRQNMGKNTAQKTAKALGLTVPLSLFTHATRFIE